MLFQNGAQGRVVGREETRVLDETDANHEHVTTYEHDSLHVMVRRVDAEGNVTTWAHDGLGRVLEESIDLGSGAFKTRTWGFDDNDRMVGHEDDAQNETTWSYNARDLATAENYADSTGKDFGYDLADNLSQWIDPNGTEVDLTYDDADRCTAGHHPGDGRGRDDGGGLRLRRP